MGLNKVLKVKSDAELLSFMINQDPILSNEIDLPVQGQSIQPIGELIMSNERYKNAFLNTINLVGLTVIDRNYWENPWENFANKGQLRFGQTVREMIVDIANVYDYNETANDPENFLKNVVPNVYQYLHEINYQKYYKTTTSDEQMAMAFATEDGLFDLIEKIIGSLYEAYKYDKYIVDKYQLCRRILNGTMTVHEISDYATKTTREVVAEMKGVANKMSFRSPNYNPTGVRVANNFDDLILIMNTDFEASMSTDVLATSFFRNDAEFKTHMALIDGFSTHDTNRLQELLGSQYVPFTSTELSELAKVPAVIVSFDFFQDYYYALNNDPASRTEAGLKKTDFFNPETLKRNHWLHIWAVISTSPYAQGVVFTKDVTPAVNSVTVSPEEMSISAGNSVQLSSVVATTGFANKGVTYSITQDPETDPTKKATVDLNGKVTIPAGHMVTTSNKNTETIVVTATSVFDKTKKGTCIITVL